MDFFALSGLINGIVALFLGGLVFVKDWRSKTNQLFFFMTLAIALWAFSYWQWLSSGFEMEALLWVRLLAIGSMFIPVFFFHWTMSLLNLVRENKTFLWIIYGLVLFFTLFSFTDLFVKGVSQKLFFPFWPNPGIFYSIYFFLIYVCLVTYSLILLIKNFRSSDGNKRGQIFFVILGTVFGFGGGLTNFFLWYNVLIPPYGNVVVALFPFFLGYASLRHKLFDIKVIATELLTFALWIFILIRTLLADTLSEQIINGSLLILLIVIGILLIRSVRREVETRKEIERLAKDLEKVNARLKDLDQLKSEFLSIASHQMRSPLTSIKGYASLIVEGSYGAISRAVREAVSKIFTSSETMINVVEDFLNVSRIEQGRMQYDFETADIAKIAGGVVEELRPVALKKGLTLSFSTDHTNNYRAKVDIDKLKQVFVNLVDNSIKYTPKGTASVAVLRHGNKIRAVFSDSGVGMSEDDMARLFQKFSRAKGANNVNVKGTGLGLYVASEMMKAHKGRIWAESDGKGSGSTFYIELNALD